MKEILRHDWGVLGSDRISRFPSKVGDKRRISVSIYNWAGFSLGAKHFSVRIKEQNNQWWCESENAWVEISCDTTNRGYSMNADVLSKKEVIKITMDFISMIAGKKRINHVVEWSGLFKPDWVEEQFTEVKSNIDRLIDSMQSK